MNPTKKFWYDENSEPPKNYVWIKGGKQYEFSINERRWKENNSSEGSDSSSKEVTIDDVVKFMHDEINFPYTTYNEIPDVPSDSTITEENIGDIYKGGTIDIRRLESSLSDDSVEISILFQAPLNYFIVTIDRKTIG